MIEINNNVNMLSMYISMYTYLLYNDDISILCYICNIFMLFLDHSIVLCFIPCLFNHRYLIVVASFDYR